VTVTKYSGKLGCFPGPGARLQLPTAPLIPVAGGAEISAIGRITTRRRLANRSTHREAASLLAVITLRGMDDWSGEVAGER
jgi:hypothetical protein